MPELSVSRDAVLEQLRSSEEAAASLASGLSSAQANWQPKQGAGWSIWQCLDHLARINAVYTAALLDALAKASRTTQQATTKIEPGWLARWFIGQMEPPVRRKFATVKSLVPLSQGDIQDGVKAFVQSHKAVHRVLDSWDAVNLNRVRFKNPFVPLLRFSVGTGILVINAHDRRHLWQAERAKDMPDFPRA